MDDEDRKLPIPGLILIALGILFILSNFGILDIGTDVIWTYIVIFIGVIFWIGFLLDRSNPGLLMPGTVLLTVGILFNYCARSGWYSLSYLWPFFILAPAFGFYAMFIFGNREKGLLFPAGILTIIGLYFLLQALDFSIKLVFGIILLLIGVLLVMRSARGREE